MEETPLTIFEGNFSLADLEGDFLGVKMIFCSLLPRVDCGVPSGVGCVGREGDVAEEESGECEAV